MENENEKKGLFGRFTGNKKTKKGSCCCCNIEVEEIPEEDKKKDEAPEINGNEKPCCK